MENFEKERKFETIIKKYQDLRGLDMSALDLVKIPVENLISTTFDTQTKWPPKEKLPAGFDSELILEDGKNPGLGIRELHAEGITGKGINVAIIDQKLLTDHEEYEDSLIDYEEVGEIKHGPEMHGSAVTSLLSGKQCGVAPDAKVFYRARTSVRNSDYFNYNAKALKDVIEYNKNSSEKIRVVSCSFGYNEEKKEDGVDDWMNTLEQAKKEGIIVIHCSMKDIDFTGCGGQSKEDVLEYDDHIWSGEENSKALRVPSDYRTYASSEGNNEYEYRAEGGLSWSVPYLVGIICLMLQIDSSLKNEEIFEYINKGYTTNKDGLHIINPRSIIDLVSKNLSE